jgi:hypothetical protein
MAQPERPSDFIFGTREELDQWRREQDRARTPEERIERMLELNRRLYPKRNLPLVGKFIIWQPEQGESLREMRERKNRIMRQWFS